LAPHVELDNAEGWIEACGLDARMTCVSMGNPHLVLFCRDTAAVPLARVGPMLEAHPLFPKRINVHFVAVHGPGEVTMRTWERGSGITLACGTGASAVCVAGSLTGRADRKILAHLPGGDLELEWAIDGRVFMTGPATEVFSGEWP
jgi:diaminopimelate epimerase